MYASISRSSKTRLAALSGAIALALVAGSAQAQVTQSAERKNMNRVGHTDLQGRPSYQPNVIQYPDGRTILFVGQHSGNPRGQVGGCPNNTLPNPLNGGACANNGTMIIDVTDTANPVEKYLIPAPTGGQAQMVRMCLGSDLPSGTPGHVYLQRNVQGGAQAGYEVWDVTDVTAPTAGIGDTQPALNPQAMVGMQHGHHVCAGQQGCQLHAESAADGLAPVASDAGARLEQSQRNAYRHPHVRSAGRAAGRDGHDAGRRCMVRSPRTSIRTRRGAWRAAHGRRHHRQPHLRGMGRRRRRRDDHHRPQEAAPACLGGTWDWQPRLARRGGFDRTELADGRVLPDVARSGRSHVDAGLRNEAAELPEVQRVRDP